MITTQITRAARWLTLAMLVAVGACFDDQRVDVASPASSEEAELGVKVSKLNAAIGDRITVAVEATSSSEIYAIQGHLRFDPSRLGYLGQVPDRNAIVIINESSVDRGRIRLAAFSPKAMDARVAKFAFEVRSPSYTSGISFEVEVAGNAKQERLRSHATREVGLDTQLPAADEPVHWNHEEWAFFWDPSIRNNTGDTPTSIPGLPAAGAVYGNTRTDALSPGINVLDASDVGNTSVGNREVIIGTDTVFTAGVDRVTSGNVRPVASGACTVPGFDNAACTSRTINVLDAQAISLESVGTDVAVVGDAIVLPKSSFASGDTVFVPAGLISGVRRFDRDSLYVLQGTLIVGKDTGQAVAAGELVVESGTTVEGTLNSAIYVTRNGRLIADGTPTQPITFTCFGAKAPQCWGGVFIAGNAVINEQDAAEPLTAPVIANRNPTGGQKQRRGEGGAVNHGGGNDADSSGVLRYVRFMYGGRILTANNELNNLTIGSCGSKTVIDHIQVHGGSDDGLEIFGGRCNVRYLYASANDDDQFDYSFGYDGNVQFLIMQHARVGVDTGDKGFEVDNTETAATYNNLPRVNPQVYNVTSVGGTFIRPGTPPDTVGTEHAHYRRGAGGTIRNVIMIGGERAFIFDNVETCPASSGLSWNNVAILPVGATMFTEIAGNAACSPSPLGAAKMNTAYAGQLKAPFHTSLPDYRPTGSGIAGLAAATPPSNGFFDTSATFVGAVAPVDFTGFPGTIAWYLGWTLPWRGPNSI